MTFNKLQNAKIRRAMRSINAASSDWLQDRAKIRDQIRANQYTDKQGRARVYAYEWGRDCDLCESDSVTSIPATVAAFTLFAKRVNDNAEGPCSASIISPENAADYRPHFRDRAAELMNY